MAKPQKVVNKLTSNLVKSPSKNSIQQLAHNVPGGDVALFVGQHPQFFEMYLDRKQIARIRVKQVTSKSGYKWRLCVRYHFEGKCRLGDACTFWHGPTDTRDKPLFNTKPASVPSKSKPVTRSANQSKPPTSPPTQTSEEKTTLTPLPVQTLSTASLVDQQRVIGGKTCFLVPQEKKCHEIVADLQSQEVIAVDCEGVNFGAVNGKLCLVQIATTSHVYIFDMCSAEKTVIIDTLKPLFANPKILKVLHSAENDNTGLGSVGIVNENFEDTQTLHQILHKDLRKTRDAKDSIGLKGLMELYGFKHELKTKMKKVYKGRPDIWARRPLTEEMIEYAACDVAALTTIYTRLKEEISAEIVLKSKNRAMPKKQKLMEANKTFAGALGTPMGISLNLSFTDAKSPDRRLIVAGDPLPPTPLKSNTNESVVRADNEKEEQKLLRLLPEEINHAVRVAARGAINKVIEIVVDLGRVPVIRFNDDTDATLDGEEVLDMEPFVATILQNSQRADFSRDNRIGIEGSLHRIAAIKSTDNRVTGLTYRIGRHFPHSAEIFTDLIARVAPQKISVLLVGEPGRGKTTLLREFARLLADEYRQRVMIVDTSNEIGGDGDIAHKCIGRARRMPVLDKSSQHTTMVEAVQNHNPTVIVIDEIGTPKEVTAAKTISQRGVSLIGTAHGTSFDSLMKNPELVPLLGGIKEVFLSDKEATKNKDGTKSKVKHERGGSPTFNVIIEIITKNEFVIYDNVASIVDAKLNRKRYVTERRWFSDGQMFCKLEEHDTWA